MVQWKNPRVWRGGEIDTAALMNIYARDNMQALKTPPFASGSTGNVNTTSTSFVEMTNSSASITTNGGDILYWACGTVSNSVGGQEAFDLAVDGIKQGHITYGTTLLQGALSNYADILNLLLITTTTPGAGVHSASLFWKAVTGTVAANMRFYIMEIR